MSGQLYGFFFKSVVNSLLMGNVLFPEIKRRIDAMKDDAMYPWEDYTTIVNKLAVRLGPFTLRKCGIALMKESEAFYRSNGFLSMDDMMSRFDRGFKSSVIGAPAHDGVDVVRFSPGSVALRFGAIQPKALSEGYIYGSAEIFNATITKIQCDDKVIDGHEFYEFSVEWR